MSITYSTGFIGYFVAFNAPNNLFEKPEERKNWDESQKLNWFANLWNRGFAQCVVEGKPITAEAARNQLELGEEDSRNRFFKDEMQHRLVRYLTMSFIVQLNETSRDELQVDQIWFVKSSDYDPLKICVTFPSTEAKTGFISLADSSDKFGNRLLERLVKEYMHKHGLRWE